MKIVLFVEGDTEYAVIPDFLKRWLDTRLKEENKMLVGVQAVRFDGWAEMEAECAARAKRYLNAPKEDVIAVLGLLDLYGPTFYPSDRDTASKRYDWAKAYIEKKVGAKKFSQHFAVHEIEAWLLSDPAIFPPEIKKALTNKYPHPEQVNSTEPPAKLLNELYQKHLKRPYRKTVDGRSLFAKLNPATAYSKCPKLKMLLDEMLTRAQELR